MNSINALEKPFYGINFKILYHDWIRISLDLNKIQVYAYEMYIYMYIYMCIYILYMYIHGKLNTRSWYTYIFFIYILIYYMALNIYTMYVSHGIYIYMHNRAKIRPINRF